MTINKTPLLKISNISISYNHRNGYVLSGVTLQAEEGEMILLMGPNGGGKSTLLKAIIGLVKPVEGWVKIMGRDPTLEPDIRRVIGYVPQLSELNIHAPITVKDLVSFGRYPYTGLLKKLGEEDTRIIEESIRKVNLENVADMKISEISIGQLARAAIARVLAQNPKIYLLDEPFESIDKPTEQMIMDILKEEKRRGKLIIVAEHHIPEKGAFDKIVLVNRRVIAYGRPEEVLTEHNLRLAYNIPDITSLLS